MIDIDRYKEYAPVILRYTLVIVYFYFGISQLVNPAGFIGYLPKEAVFIPVTPRTLVLLNGGFEVFAATLLALGLYTRIIALLLGLHLAAITLSVGYNDTGVRDFGLSLATLALFFFGPTKWSLDNVFRNRSKEA